MIFFDIFNILMKLLYNIIQKLEIIIEKYIYLFNNNDFKIKLKSENYIISKNKIIISIYNLYLIF